MLYTSIRIMLRMLEQRTIVLLLFQLTKGDFVHEKIDQYYDLQNENKLILYMHLFSDDRFLCQVFW